MRSALSLAFALTLSLCGYAAQAASSSSVSMDANLDQMEQKLFQHDYSADKIDVRVSRLEKMVFGENEPGTVDHRIAKLIAAVLFEPSDSATGQPASGSTATGKQNSGDQSPPADSSQYPRVTALEHELLGKTHEGEPIGQRLAALETKTFGKPSTSTDLGDRTDQIERYAEVYLHKTPFGVNPEMVVADTSPVTYRRGGAIPASYHAPSVAQARPAEPAAPRFMPAPASDSPMLEKVSWMEGQLYGQEYEDDHLLDRLRRLDSTLFPNERSANDMRLMDQVDSMIGAVQMMQHQRQTGSAQQLIASNSNSAVNAYKKPPAQTATKGDEDDGDSAPSSRSNSNAFDRDLANCLGAATNLAAGMTGNSWY